MSNIDDTEEHRNVEKILQAIAQIMQMQDDFIDCWGNSSKSGKIGTDIQEGKCTWLIVTAVNIANEEQMEVLRNNYGRNDLPCIKNVKNIFEELNLKEIYHKEEKNQFNKICAMIDESKTKSKINFEIYSGLLEKIYIHEK